MCFVISFDLDKGGPWLKIRYLVVFCGFLANAVGYMMRVNLSVAIVAMTVENGTSVEGPEDVPVSHYVYICILNIIYDRETNPDSPESKTCAEPIQGPEICDEPVYCCT